MTNPPVRRIPLMRRRSPSLSAASESPPWPASPLLAGLFFFRVRRSDKEGEVRAPISKHVRAAINGHRKRTKRKSSGRMSRTSSIFFYISVYLYRGIERCSAERANPARAKELGLAIPQGRSSKASHIKTAPFLHLIRLSFLMFKKRGGSGMEEGGLPLCSEPSRIGGR